MIFYYKIDFVSVADIAFKFKSSGELWCRYAPISARFLWSHAWTLARLMPHSLSPTLPLVNNCLRHPRLHLSFAPLARLMPRSLSLHLGFRLDVACRSLRSLCSHTRFARTLVLAHAPSGRTGS